MDELGASKGGVGSNREKQRAKQREKRRSILSSYGWCRPGVLRKEGRVTMELLRMEIRKKEES